MKILFINKFFYLNGGSEKVFFQERSFFKNKGYHIVDFSMKDKRNFTSAFENDFVPNIEFQKSGNTVKKICQAVSFVHSPVSVRRIKKLILEEKPEIAHLHNIYHQLTPSIIPVLKSYGIKIIMTLHDYKMICPSYLALNDGKICNACQGRFFLKPIILNCQDSFYKSALMSMEAFFHKWKKSYGSVDLFIAPSQFMATHTAQRIPAEKIKVLRNGVDIDAYHPEYNDDEYALYFGRLSKEKGIKTLLKATRLLKNNLPLKIVGTGPLEIELRKQYPDAEFLGYKTGDELKRLISRAAFVIVPSEWYENCSMVVLEAMAFGKPVIGSKIGGIPEQVEDGETGFLFDMENTHELADKMILLWSDKILRRRLGKNARKKLENEYALNDHCQNLKSIYKDLLSNG